MAARGRHDRSCTTTKLQLLTLLKKLQKSGSLGLGCLEAITYCMYNTRIQRYISVQYTCDLYNVIGENLFRPSHVSIYQDFTMMCQSSFEGYGFFKLKDYVTA